MKDDGTDSISPVALWVSTAVRHSGMTQAQLARAVQEKLKVSFDRSKANKILAGERRVAAEEMLAIEEVTGYPIPASLRPEVPSNARYGGSADAFTRVPLRGRGMGGKDGALIFDTGEELEYVEAPPKLHGVPGAYAVYVIGDSMLDRYANGEIVFVHPRLPLNRGDYCVIQATADGEATVQGFIKRFVSMDDHVLKVEQLNPKKILTFPRKNVRNVHKIIMGGST